MGEIGEAKTSKTGKGPVLTAREILNMDYRKLDPDSVYPDSHSNKWLRGLSDGGTLLHTFFKTASANECRKVIEALASSDALRMQDKYMFPLSPFEK